MNAPKLAEIAWSEPLLPPPLPLPPATRALVESAYGEVTWTPSLMHAPWVLELACDGLLVPVVHLPAELGDLLHLVVAQDNSCRYCYGVSRAMLQILGYPESLVRQLEEDLLAADLDPGLKAALDYARNVSRANPRVGRAHAEALVAAGMSPEAVPEVAALAAIWVFENRVTTLVAAPPNGVEGLLDRWYAPIVKLVARWSIARARKKPHVITSDAPVGGLEPLVAKIGATPSAALVRKLVAAAFGDRPGPLPQRTRLLVGAVVGRTLGCRTTEREVGAALAATGVDPERVDGMLATLDADWLDDRERPLVRVARDTVRPQPAVVQKRMGELRAKLTDAEFVDFVGVAAAANAVARLTVLLDGC